MKKLLPLFILINIFLSLTSKAQEYKWITHKPQGNTLFGLHFINDSTGWAVGDFGTIIKTEDYGKNWEIQNSGTYDTLNSVHFSDKNIGCVIGKKFILSTKDGGKSWEKLNISFPEKGTLLFSFSSPFTGWLVHTNGILYATLDGGLTWEKKESDSFKKIGAASSVYFLNDKKGWVFSIDGSLHQTEDGGENWSKVSDTELDDAKRIQFINDSTGFCIEITDYGRLFKTTDGGKSWTSMRDGFSNKYASSFFFFSEMVGFTCEGGSISRTKDGGETWEFLFNPLDMPETYFTSEYNGYVAGEYGNIYRILDGGKSFDKLNQDSATYTAHSSIHNVVFKNLYEGWMVKEFAPMNSKRTVSVLKTIDGGDNWFPEITHYEDTVWEKVYLLDDKSLIVNATTFLLKSTDNGNTWKKFQHPVWLSDLNFINEQEGWGEVRNNYEIGQTLFKTNDGGETWDSVGTHAAEQPDFLNSDVGWGEGKDGIYKTLDGGKSWEFYPIDLTDEGHIFDLEFISENEGFIASANEVFKTRDGGLTWTRVLFLDDEYPWKIGFVNGKDGYVTCFLGRIYRTKDGGETWVKELNYGYSSFLIDHFILDPETAFFIGVEKGALIRRTGSNKPNPVANVIQGTVYVDNDKNCSQDDKDIPITDRIIKAEPGPYFGITDSKGNYQIQVDTGVYVVSQLIPDQKGQKTSFLCPPGNSFSVDATKLNDTIRNIDFANTVTSCAYLDVNIMSDRRRRCFRNNTYVNYSNTGYAAQTNVAILVQFPPYVKLVTADVPWTVTSDSLYLFNLGDLAVSQSGRIRIVDSVVCGDESIRNLTQCTKAWILPGNSCEVPDPLWDKSSIAVEGVCNGDFVNFLISNKGEGDMTDSSHYRVFFDDELVGMNKFKIQAGKTFPVNVRANGSTIRLEADQSLQHPGISRPNISIENCGKNDQGESSRGFVAGFYLDDESPELDIDCMPIIDSYDPNDKAITPEGLTSEHYVKPGTELEYTIRFQNKGSDVAYNVIVVDTISDHLDPSTLKIGVVSHPYTLSATGKGKLVLTFTFKDINLPNESADEPGSHGSIRFKITPYDTTDLNTKIENFADIFFDYNSPVRTNTPYVTISDYTPFDPTKLNIKDAECTSTTVSLKDFEKVCHNAHPFLLVGGEPEGGVFFGEGVVDGYFDPAKAGVGEHLIKYKFTSENTCTDSISKTINVELCTGKEKELKNQFKVYPNPGKGIFTIEPGKLIKGDVKVEIINSAGAVIYTGNHSLRNNLTIDLGDYPAGLYLLRISANKKTAIQNIVLE